MFLVVKAYEQSLLLDTLTQVWPLAVDCELFNPDRACPEMRRRLAGGAADSAAVNSAVAASAGAGDGNDGDGGDKCVADGVAPVLLSVGRVSFEKNLQLLRSVLQQVPGARLAIVGDGPALEVGCRGG